MDWFSNTYIMVYRGSGTITFYKGENAKDMAQRLFIRLGQTGICKTRRKGHLCVGLREKGI